MKNYLIVLLFGCTFPFWANAQQVKYTAGNNGWNADSLGNQRALVSYTGAGKIAKVNIEWRRSDPNPEQKAIIVQDAKTGKKIENILPLLLNKERGIICFEPTSGAGTYYIYYQPYKNEGRSNYPKGIYPKQGKLPNWIAPKDAELMPVNAKALQLESINAFNNVYPMEVIATSAEVAKLKAQHAEPAYLVFPEYRMYPIVMKNDIPQRWIANGPQKTFADIALRGENFSFQLGIYALKDLQHVKLKFSDLKDKSGNKIASQLFSCLNTDGTTYDGKPFSKEVDVPQNQVQALWCLLNVPTATKAGTYTGTVEVSVANAPVQSIKISLKVDARVSKENGINEPWKQTRLTWLNSTLAQSNTVIAPYTPLKVEGTSISLLGRKVELDKNGFPKQIQTFFSPEMTDYTTTPNNLLAENIHFHFVRKADGKNIVLKDGGVEFTKKEAGTVQWKTTSANDSLQMDIAGSLEFDGFMSYTVKVTALKDLDLKDVTMHIPFNKTAATYLMGFGQKGGERPEKFEWKWDVANKNQDGAWLGNVNAGLQYSLRDEKYVRPLNTNFYLQKPLLLPTSWGNGNKGGVSIGIKGSSMLANNYTGEREMKKGEVQYYNFTLLITPFHTINTDFQWENRFYHKYNSIDSIKATGATVVNIHHATPINPWINYPFIEYGKMKSYIAEAHSKGLKVKIYNTVRELSNRAYETFPMRSLGHEIYSPGKGGGFSWLQEHVKDDYIAAWFVPEIKDAAIVNSGMSRWHNYYVEGMNWLTKNVGIDGIYLDDVAFDRITMKRIKRVLTQDGHPGIIDLHSANQYNKSDGFNNSANLYMEHFPYLNRLWFGEYFDYEKNKPDFFLTEVSGIPFGLMGEMLQDGGNQWRGMIYGMTNRLPWSGNNDPRPIWKVWDDFGMKGTKMIGYWSTNCPVKTSNPQVLATVYKKQGAALVAIASWADQDEKVTLNIDWQKLGIDPAKASINIPGVTNFQQAQQLTANSEITVPKAKGYLIVIKQH
ncbi:glycoside hydrolase domain-containing protein [Pedobacter sp. KR3-3]|uniref:Glycoside hydrolase domain-containing protein n=1 Tax=Pedobacter albus TaxID=3113905 RepID=A0ABU7I6C7_9SPHI|nr:glycoside hydrolase domain-containing protein [Pedobacter sp. KR3-3]MEE1945027.1 glycoside hydrolase domain-containing protein [Pedobacter sp. KR3-3]